MNAQVSLLQLIQYSGLPGQLIIFLSLLLVPLTIAALVQVSQAIRIVLGRETNRAIDALRAGSDPGHVVAAWSACTDGYRRWPHLHQSQS